MINIHAIYAEAKRLAVERGHNPDLTDLDKIVEDAIDLAHAAVSTETVLSFLDTLIADNLEMHDNSCLECGHPYKAGDETHYSECSRLSVAPVAS